MEITKDVEQEAAAAAAAEAATGAESGKKAQKGAAADSGVKKKPQPASAAKSIDKQASVRI